MLTVIFFGGGFLYLFVVVFVLIPWADAALSSRSARRSGRQITSVPRTPVLHGRSTTLQRTACTARFQKSRHSIVTSYFCLVSTCPLLVLSHKKFRSLRRERGIPLLPSRHLPRFPRFLFFYQIIMIIIIIRMKKTMRHLLCHWNHGIKIGWNENLINHINLLVYQNRSQN